MATWQHPELGQFIYKQYMGWSATAEHAVFANMRDASKAVQVCINAYDPDEYPTEALIEVGIQTLKNCNHLVNEGIQILLDDFHGNRPDTGIWWHASIEQIHEILDRPYPPDTIRTIKELFPLLHNPLISIQEQGYGYPKPCSVISFDSPIEEEHGIGVLTDGHQVIGIGFQIDACAFEEE